MLIAGAELRDRCIHGLTRLFSGWEKTQTSKSAGGAEQRLKCAGAEQMTLIEIAVIVFGVFAGYWVVSKLFLSPPKVKCASQQRCAAGPAPAVE